MRIKRRLAWDCILTLALLTGSALANDGASRPSLSGSPHALEGDQPGSIRFYGSPEADLFTREIDESFRGVLRKNYVAKTDDKFPAGFVHASPPPQLWSGTFWTRDGGTFMRELVQWGYFEHAAQLAECLMDLVEKNKDGFYSFPEYFAGKGRGSGTELDGTTSIIIGMVLLWERLPADHPTRARIRDFLTQSASPVQYLKSRLSSEPLVAGSGEFGGGCGIPGEYYNVVQNNLAMLALRAAANLAEETGDAKNAKECRDLAAKLADGMEKYLVDGEGCWIWCVDPKTRKPDPAIVNHEINLGFGGLNGPACMYSDVLGFEPLASDWKGAAHCEKTFMHLYNVPQRKQQFDKYGIWAQFDVFRAGASSDPSYGDGYALQTMLLYDKLEMAGKSLAWLANSTYKPVPEYKLDRESPYHFYERSYSPDAVGRIPLEQGCGVLNLVNVTEPLKVARLVLGVDDTSAREVRIIPRVPPSWMGVEAKNWPIRTRSGVVRADIRFEKKGKGAELSLKVAAGQQIGNLKVRMPSAKGNVWQERKNARDLSMRTE
jgi:hypothetical protein